MFSKCLPNRLPPYICYSLFFSFHRSLWIICGILLYFSEVDVWCKSGPVWVHVWPGGAAWGRAFYFHICSQMTPMLLSHTSFLSSGAYGPSLWLHSQENCPPRWTRLSHGLLCALWLWCEDPSFFFSVHWYTVHWPFYEYTWIIDIMECVITKLQ